MGTNITGIGNANAIGFKSRVTGGTYFPPKLKDALIGVWSAYGKSNNSTDRNIIKNKIKDRGGDFVISNAAFKLNSGFGKYAYSEGDHGRSRRYDRRDDDEMYDRIMDYIESRGRGRSSRSMSPHNEIGFRRNSRRDEEYREDDDRHIMRILGYGYDGDDDRHRSRKHRRDHDEHFDERGAYDTVEEMYHVKGDKKYVGEKFDMDKAHKVYEKLRDADGYTIGDIYVAINAQYHDYCELFEKWFGNNFDEKIIASAVDFWFEDDDFEGNKVWKYFNEM